MAVCSEKHIYVDRTEDRKIRAPGEQGNVFRALRQKQKTGTQRFSLFNRIRRQT